MKILSFSNYTLTKNTVKSSVFYKKIHNTIICILKRPMKMGPLNST